MNFATPSIVCSLLTATLCAQQEFVVDRAGRPGTTHATIQAAIDAASPGDRVVVRRDGRFPYEGFTLTKGLDIRGNYREFPQVAFAEIRDVPAGQAVNLERLVLRTRSFPVVRVTSCTGAITLRQVFAVSENVGLLSDPTMQIRDSAQVVFDQGGVWANATAVCVVTGSHVAFHGVEMRGSVPLPTLSGDPLPCLVVDRSEVLLHACDITGGSGLPARLDALGVCLQDGGDGTPAVRATESEVLVAGGTRLAGGPGGPAFGACRVGARGPAYEGSRFRLDPSVVVEGAASGTTRGIPTQPSVDGLPVVLDAGLATSIDFAAEPAGAWTLFVDLAPGLVAIPGIEVPFQLSPGHLPILHGVVPASGSLAIPIATGRDPALIERVLWFQAGVLHSSSDIRLSNAGSMRLR